MRTIEKVNLIAISSKILSSQERIETEIVPNFLPNSMPIPEDKDDE